MLTPNGGRAIESLRERDVVVAITSEGKKKEVTIYATIKRRSRLLTVVTDGGALVTTEEHPLWMGGEIFRNAGTLKPGDQVMMWIADAAIPVTVVMLERGHEEVDVYNMEVGSPHVYVANGFVVHNKLTPPSPT